MTLDDYCKRLGWNAAELARRANINIRTAQRAMEGQRINAENARAIARALSEELGRTVHVGDLEGLNYR